jgi:hypothetical protein
VTPTEDRSIRVIGAKTSAIVLADEAEYNLGRLAYGQWDAEWFNDERPVRARFAVAPKAAIVTSALQRSSTVLTATVASGATEGLQPGQWVCIAASGVAIYDGIRQVATTTATTITFAIADSGSVADAGIVTIKVDAAVFAVSSDPVVLWDSIVDADNQDENLGAAQRGIYTVISDGFHESVYCDGAAFLQYAQNVTAAGPLDVTHDEVADETSDTLTALFVSSGDVLLRNGADVATALTVTFQPMDHVGLDQDGLVCFYVKRASKTTRPALRLKNRSGASLTLSLRRIA